MKKEDYFIDLYNELDTYLRVKHFNNNPAYTSYSKKIFYVKKHKLEAVFKNDKDFDVLKKAGEIRNIIAHNNDIIIPSDKFLNRFESLVKRITNPLRIDQIMTKYRDLITLTTKDKLRDVIDVMSKHGFGQIPILEDNLLKGIFTEKTIHDFLTISERIVDKDMPLHQLSTVIDLDNKPRRFFRFVARDMNVDQAYEIFTKDFREKHELIVLLVTEHGQSDELLLGIVALRDLKNALSQYEWIYGV